MPLWTDIIEPAELSGFARASLQAFEDRNGSLERWLPNTHVDDISVKFVIGDNGLQEAAEFRAFDAEPTIARQSRGRGVQLELPAIGQKMPVSEYRALRLRNASDDAYRSHILKTTNQIVRAIADRMEQLRGVVLDSGKATVDQRDFNISDDFGRPSGHNVTAGTLWTTAAVDRIGHLLAWQDTYATTNNGTLPGALLMSTRSYGALKAGDQFVNAVTGRPMSRQDINSVLVDEGLPPIYIYDRKIKSYEGVTARVTSDENVLFLPAPGAEGESGRYLLGHHADRNRTRLGHRGRRTRRYRGRCREERQRPGYRGSCC